MEYKEAIFPLGYLIRCLEVYEESTQTGSSVHGLLDQIRAKRYVMNCDGSLNSNGDGFGISFC